MRLIVNPTSRSGRSRARLDFWLAELSRERQPYALSLTRGPGDAAALAREASETVVVAVGGDGTINEVLDGVLQSASPKTMGVLYAGTSPDFCRFNRIPFDDSAAALRTLLGGQARRVDAVKVVCADGPPAHFACGCNIGMGARVAAFANRYRRTLGDAAGTGLGLALAVCRQRRFSARLLIDCVPHEFPDANHVFVLKNPHIASGLRLDLPLAPDDGSLVVVAVHGLGRAALLRLLPAFYSGAAATHPAVFSRTCRSVTVETDPPQAVEFDGDPRGRSPVMAAVLPRALSLICEAEHA